jgi:hypothetical protein
MDSRSHAEGLSTRAVGPDAHAEGCETLAGAPFGDDGWPTEDAIRLLAGDQNYYAHTHAEGFRTKAIRQMAHAEGDTTVASGTAAHAGGRHSEAEGIASFAHGLYTTAKKDYQFVVGKYNKFTTGNDD